MKIRTTIIVIAAAFLLAGCLVIKTRPGLVAYTLPSGKVINPTNVSKMDFPQGESALVMSYQTDIPVSDKEKLRQEVDELWKLFVKDVEAANLKAGALRPSNADGHGYGFLFQKKDDGSWEALDDRK